MNIQSIGAACAPKGSPRHIEPDPFGEIHPRTASELGIEDGDWMIVRSPKGAIKKERDIP